VLDRDDHSVDLSPAPLYDRTEPSISTDSMNAQLVAAIGICVVVFGIGGFALGWSAGKRAYRDRMPAMDPEDIDEVDPEELEAVESWESREERER
jgi:hypothetical protein